VIVVVQLVCVLDDGQLMFSDLECVLLIKALCDFGGTEYMDGSCAGRTELRVIDFFYHKLRISPFVNR